jgi:hypothetical protein
VVEWSDENVLAKVRAMVLLEIECQGPLEAWIIDDTGLPKKRATFGWGFLPILRTTRQTSELMFRFAARCETLRLRYPVLAL